MKKLIFIAFMLVLSISVMAQRSGSTTGMGGASLKTLSLTAADTTAQGATTYWTFNVNIPESYYFCFAAAIDRLEEEVCVRLCHYVGNGDGLDD